MEAVSAVATDCGAGCGCACEVKEDAGIRPFFEPWKTRHEYGNGSRNFPETQNGEEVHGVIEERHDAMRVDPILPNLRGAAAADKKRDKAGHCPIDDGF